MSSSLRLSLLLLAAGLLPESRAQTGPDYLMMIAIPGGATAKVQRALKKGANPNRGDGAPLTQAAQGYSVGVVLTLLRGGAKVRHVDRYGLTPLWYTTGRLNARVPNFGRRRAAITRALIAAGARVDARNRDGMTPLQRAVMSQNLDVVEVLLAAGADPKAADKRGDTPLHEAARWVRHDHSRNDRIVDLLLRAGADPRKKNAQGRSAAALASPRSHLAKRTNAEKAKPSEKRRKKLILPGG